MKSLLSNRFSAFAFEANADAHPLMNRMHKPDPKLGPTEQDKHSVAAIEPADGDTWLRAPIDEAPSLIRLTPAVAFDARPEGRTELP